MTMHRKTSEIGKDVKALLDRLEKKIASSLHERPSKEMLDRLSILAGFQDWESFRKEINEGEDEAQAQNGQ